MIKISFKQLFFVYILSVFSVSCISSCDNNFYGKTINEINLKDDYFISGKVDLNSFKSSSMNIKRTDEISVAEKALISVVYSDETTDVSLKNKVVASGITDNFGNFDIKPNKNFAPKNGDIFILEAIKRFGGFGTKLISLRTLIKWNGSNWESISKPYINISKKTTAISLLTILSNNQVKNNELIGTLSINTDGTNTINFNDRLRANVFYQLLYSIDLFLLQDKDPVENIYQSSNLYFSGLENKLLEQQLIAQINTIRSIVLTYFVDRAVYPDLFIKIKEEAIKRSYWRNIINPFTGEINTIIDYDEYLQVKDTLLFRGKKIYSMEEMAGYLVYQPIKDASLKVTGYKIYGISLNGSFLKFPNGVDDYFLGEI